MKILKHRDNKNYIWKYEFHCSCGCHFIADNTEIAEREKSLDGRLWAICPECGNKIEPINRNGWKEVTISPKNEKEELIDKCITALCETCYCSCENGSNKCNKLIEFRKELESQL